MKSAIKTREIGGTDGKTPSDYKVCPSPMSPARPSDEKGQDAHMRVQTAAGKTSFLGLLFVVVVG